MKNGNLGTSKCEIKIKDTKEVNEIYWGICGFSDVGVIRHSELESCMLAWSGHLFNKDEIIESLEICYLDDWPEDKKLEGFNYWLMGDRDYLKDVMEDSLENNGFIHGNHMVGSYELV